MKIKDIYTSCANIVCGCSFCVYRDEASYLANNRTGFFCLELFMNLPYYLAYEREVFSFRIRPGGRCVDVLIEEEVFTNE